MSELSTGQMDWELGVPIIETRGRPVSDEYAKLVKMPVNASFVSRKKRDALYQIARNLGITVTILAAGPLAKHGWRVWKRSEPHQPTLIPTGHAMLSRRKKGRKRKTSDAK
jgi:hypothetical protein